MQEKRAKEDHGTWKILRWQNISKYYKDEDGLNFTVQTQILRLNFYKNKANFMFKERLGEGIAQW